MASNTFLRVFLVGSLELSTSLFVSYICMGASGHLCQLKLTLFACAYLHNSLDCFDSKSNKTFRTTAYSA